MCPKRRSRRHHPIFLHLHNSQRPEFIPCLRNFEPTALPFQNTPMLQGGTCILYSVKALPLERLMKSGGEGQIIVLPSDLNNKLYRVLVLELALLTNTCLPAHPESLVTHFPLAVQPGSRSFLRRGAPSKGEVEKRCLANSHITADCLLITSLLFQKTTLNK